MKRFCLSLVAAVLLSVVTSCDNVDADERFEGPVITGVGKNVLIEDFTGQKCSNCPLAHEEAGKLQETYGKDRIVTVAIHGGPQAISETDTKFLGLANEQGKEYNRRMQLTSYPKGAVDRKGGLTDFEKWNAAVVSRISLSPKVKVSIRNIGIEYDSRRLTFACDVIGLEQSQGLLQLWLTESAIKAVQTLPSVWGGGVRTDYEHHHVFRAAVNAFNGEPLDVAESQKITKEYAYTLKAEWKPENMALVAIFYNTTEGVMQVAEVPLVNKTNQTINQNLNLK